MKLSKILWWGMPKNKYLRAATLVPLGAFLTITLAPEVLAFPYKAQFGSTTVYSEQPITEAFKPILARSDALLAQSPLYHGPITRRIFLTNSGWRWRVLSWEGTNGSFAETRELLGTEIFQRSDFATDKIYGAPDRVRTLSGVIAHETTHILQAQHFGFLKHKMVPTWVREGYADYVAQASTLTDAQYATLKSANKDDPALVYYDGRRRVAAILAKNGRSVDRLYAEVR